MKRVIALLVIISFLIFNLGYVSQLDAQQMVTEEIRSVSEAKEIARKAEGGYWEGPVAPDLTGTEVALPVIDEKTGEIIGHIVADKTKLISVLNAAGYTQVASALVAIEAGTVAGLAAGTGIGMGTVGYVAAGAAAVVGIALLIGGGGEGAVTTTAHH